MSTTHLAPHPDTCAHNLQHANIDQDTEACVFMCGNSLSEYSFTIGHLLDQIWEA